MNNAIWSTMNGLRVYHIKWSKLDQDKYNIIYIGNVKKWYKWTYLQNRNRLTDIENKFITIEEVSGGRDGREKL